MLTCLCLIDLRSPVSTFKACLSHACDCSSVPIVCACFVVACCSVILRTSTIWDTNSHSLSEMIAVGRYACLVMMWKKKFSNCFSILTCCRGGEWVSEEYNHAVTIISLPPDGCSSGILSFSMISSGPVMCSLGICRGWICHQFGILWCIAHKTWPTSWLLLPRSVSNTILCVHLWSLWFQDSYHIVRAGSRVLHQQVVCSRELGRSWWYQVFFVVISEHWTIFEDDAIFICFAVLFCQSVVSNTSLSGWPSNLFFKCFRTRSTSCYTRISAFALILIL